jgi:hypothetical protein
LLPVADPMESEGLVRVLPDFATEAGNVYFVFAARRFVPVNIRAFIDLALDATANGAE